MVKADPNVSTPTLSPCTYKEGLRLADISLPKGWTWVKENTKIGAGTHSYEAYYTPDDTEKYRTVTKNIEFTVTKGIPSCTMPEEPRVFAGTKLGDIKLPSGFVWESDAETELQEPGEYTFYVTYDPDEINYHSVKNIPFVVTVLGEGSDSSDGDDIPVGGGSGTGSGTGSGSGGTTTGGDSGSASGSGATAGGSTGTGNGAGTTTGAPLKELPASSGSSHSVKKESGSSHSTKKESESGQQTDSSADNTQQTQDGSGQNQSAQNGAGNSQQTQGAAGSDQPAQNGAAGGQQAQDPAGTGQSTEQGAQAGNKAEKGKSEITKTEQSASQTEEEDQTQDSQQDEQAQEAEEKTPRPSVTMTMEDTTILTPESLQMAKEQNLDLLLTMGQYARWSIDIDSVRRFRLLLIWQMRDGMQIYFTIMRKQTHWNLSAMG